MVARETVCLRRLGGDRGGELRAGRFFANPKVTTAKLIAGWADQTPAAARGRHVLAIQDSSEIKVPTTAARRRGLGPVGKGNAYGLIVHAMLAVDADSGACLGLVGGNVWSRDGVNPTPHRARPRQERESYRWLDTARQAEQVLGSAAMVTIVDDREADIYPKWAAARPANVHLLTRAMADRKLADGGMLFAAAAQFPRRDDARRTVALRARPPVRAGRSAVLGLRFGEVAIRRPRDELGHDLPNDVALRMIEVTELDPPAGSEPLHWRLLTTHSIADAAAAWQIVDWYRARWTIEQLFRVMKSQGLQLEDSQLGSAERLVKLTAAATKAACIAIQLAEERDRAHDLPASTAFTEAEIATLAAVEPTLTGKTARQQNPHPRASLAWAAWIIARLGGWNCYYKPPGPITFRRGLEQFYPIHRGRLIGLNEQRDVRIP